MRITNKGVASFLKGDYYKKVVNRGKQMTYEDDKKALKRKIIEWLGDKGIKDRSKIMAFLDFIKSDAEEVMSGVPCLERAASKVGESSKSIVRGFVSKLAKIEDEASKNKPVFATQEPEWKKQGYPSSRAYKAVMGDD